MNLEAIESLRSAMRDAGLGYAGDLTPDGRLHRVKCSGDHEANSWYVLYDDGPVPAGAFGCWKRSLSQNWHFRNGAQVPPKDLAAMRKQWQDAEKQRAKDEQERYERFSQKASKFCTGLPVPDSTHLYLQTKMVGIFGPLRLDGGDLVLPLQDITGKVWSYQRIDALGTKLFMPGGRIKGCFYPVCERKDGPLVICEGYATGASLHEATGWAVVCAMNCGNLMEVGKAIRESAPNRLILVAADDDWKTEGNPGLTKASEAAKSIKAQLVAPAFGDNVPRGTDFNDLALASGIETVRLQIERACPSKLSFLTLGEIAALLLPDDNVYLGDHVLSAGNLTSILAPGGLGKSFLMFQMAAACCARHERFLAWEIHPSAHHLRWLFVQAENNAHRLKADVARLRAWIGEDAWRYFNEQVRVLVGLNELDSLVDLDNPDNRIRFTQAMELYLPDIVPFDALYNFSLRELSKGSEMLASILNCVRTAKWRNPNRVPLLAHHALPGSAGSQRAFGLERANYGRDSKVLHQQSRSVINLSFHDESDSGRLIVSCGKCSDGKEFSDFAIRRNPDTLIFEIDDQCDVIEAVEKLKHPKRGIELISNNEIRELCPVSGASKSDLAKSLMNEIGCHRVSAYRRLRKAQIAGFIHFSKSEEKYFRS